MFLLFTSLPFNSCAEEELTDNLSDCSADLSDISPFLSPFPSPMFPITPLRYHKR